MGPHLCRIKARPGSPWRARQAVSALLAELRRRVDRTLLPGVKADLRINLLYRLPAPWPRFAAAHAWEGRTAYAAPVLTGYAALAPWLMGGRSAILPHATAGLIAWLIVRVFPYRAPAMEDEPAASEGLGLRLQGCSRAPRPVTFLSG